MSDKERELERQEVPETFQGPSAGEPVVEDEAPDGAVETLRNRPRKAPNAFRTISEVADDLHIPQHVLRFWETKFPQVKPLKRGGGRRYYRPDDILLLRRISDLLYIQGYTIKGVQRLLRDGDGKLSDEIPPPAPDERADGEPEAEAEADEPQPAAPGAASGPVSRPPAGASSAAELEQLQALLSRTLAELEALRALI